MTITVGAIYTAFPNFNPDDMIKLCNGNKDLNGRTVVPLANIAAFGDKNLSVFVAKKEGKTYTGMLPKNERAEINSAAKLKDAEPVQEKDNNANSGREIPRDTSVFDIAAGHKKKNIPA